MRKTTARRLVEREKKNKPWLDTDALYEIAQDTDKYTALKAVSDSPGGQVLLDALYTEAANLCDKIANNYGEYELPAFQAIGARLSVILNIARSIERSGENLLGAQEALEEALRG